jgi:hypothetical protein
MNERTIERLNERTMNDRTNYEQVDERSNERPNDPCACVGMGVRGDKWVAMKWLVVALGEALAPLFIGKVGGLGGGGED